MNRTKRFLSAILAAVMLICTLPVAAFATADPIALTVPLKSGMTLAEAVKELNHAAGLAETTSGWLYRTLATIEYTYTKIEVNASDVVPGMGWMDATPYLPSYPDLQAEAEHQLTLKEEADSAISSAFVAIEGQIDTITPFVYTLAQKVSYQGYQAGARATLNGKKTYPALDLSTLPRRVLMENAGVQYNVTFTQTTPISLIEKDPGSTYRISAGGERSDYAELTAKTILDPDSIFGTEPFDAKNLTVSLLNEQTQTFVPVTEVPPTLGVTYTVKLTYTTRLDTAELTFRAVFTDNRSVASATWGANGIEVMYPGSPEGVKQNVYDLLLTIEGTDPAIPVSDLSFEYYGIFDYAALLDTAVGESLRAQLKAAIAEAYAMADYQTLTGISVDDFMTSTVTDAWLAEKLAFETWVPFDGGEYTIKETVGEHTLGLGVISLPSVGTGSYRIRVSFAGDTLYFPFSADSESAKLTIHPALTEVSIDEIRGATSSANITRFDLSLTENKVYVTLPETIRLFTFRAGETIVDAASLYQTELHKAVTLGTLIDLYRTDLLDEDALSAAFVGDPSVISFLFDTYLEGNVRDYALSFMAPQAGHYLTFAVIGDTLTSPDFTFGPTTFGQTDDATYYISILGGIAVTETSPAASGQFYQASFSDALTAFTTFDQGLAQTAISPTLSAEYAYDGAPHGQIILTDGTNVVELGENDSIRYYNTTTGKTYTQAPTDSGSYLAIVFHEGDVFHTTRRLTYSFTIVPAKVTVTLPTIETTWGDPLGALTPTFGEGAPENLPAYEVIAQGYTGKAGTYPIIIRILETHPGYEYIVTNGQLTVNPRRVSIKVDDKNYTYGDTFEFTYTVTAGQLLDSMKTKVAFDQTIVNAGTYDLSMLSKDENLILDVTPGKIVIEKKKLTLTISTQTLLFGQTPVFTTTPAFEAVDTEILYTIDGYNEAPGTYSVSAKLSDDTNYDITFVKGKITFQKISMLMIDPGMAEVQWSDTPQFTATAYAYVGGKMVEIPTVNLTYSYTVLDAQGKPIDLSTTVLELGTYDVSCTVSGSGTAHYPKPVYKKGTLTVTKKQLEVGVTDATIHYGDQNYDPTAYAYPSQPPQGMTVTYQLPAYRTPGEYTVTPVIGGSYDTVHYDPVVKTGKLTVVKRPVIITPNAGQHKLEGETDPVLTYTVDSLAYDDVLTGALARDAGEETGEYAITLGTIAHEFYDITLAPEVFTILSASAIGITITPPTKTEYLVGEMLDLSAVEVTLHYADGSTQPVSLEDCVIRGFDPNTVGEQTVTVDYQGFTATVTVTVKNADVTFTDERFTIEEEILIIDSTAKAVKREDLVAALPEGFTLKLFKGETEQGAGKNAGTGMTLQIYAGETLVKTLTLRVKGDVNGDGILTQTDAVLALHHFTGKRVQEGQYALAADVVGNPNVTQTDAVRILKLATTFER